MSNKICGIYKIVSPNNKVYIGQSVDINNRKSKYKKCQCVNQLLLYNSLKKYGFKNHIFEIIHIYKKDELNKLEKHYVELYKSNNTDCGLNVQKGGFSVYNPKLSNAIRRNKAKRMSALNKKRYDIYLDTGKGYRLKGDKGTYEQKKALKLVHTNNIGRIHDDDTKLRIRIAHLGVKKGPHSKKTKRKIGDGVKGFKHTTEAKNKIRKARLGSKRGSYKKLKYKQFKNPFIMNENTHVWLRGLPKDLVTEDRILNFKDNKVQYLTLDQLKSTVDERNTGQKPMNGILHYDLFEAIIEIFNDVGLKYELKPIAATDGGSSKYPGVATFPGFVDQYGEGSLQSHLLRRLISMFIVKGIATGDYSAGLAVAFHQEGIQVAFGPNVDICANMCILGADMKMQTYGTNKIGINKMKEVISDWAHNAEKHIKRQIEILEFFKKTELGYRDVAELVGHMSFIRIGRDHKGIQSQADYPLNQGHITRFTGDYLMKYQDLKKEEENPMVSLYDLYNMGTSLHKPEDTDLPLIISNNTALGNLFIDKFVPEKMKI